MDIKKLKLLAFILIVLLPFEIIHAQSDTLSLDQLLEIESKISGAVQWTNKGNEILYKGEDGLALVGIKEKKVKQLAPTNLGEAGHFLGSQNIRLSPQGMQIAYISTKGGNPEIWLYSMKTGDTRKLTNLGQDGLNALSWSPDGTWIAFSGNRYGNYDIWKVSVESGEVHRMTSDKHYEVYPSWTPDGNHLLYVQLNDAWTNHDVIKINSEDASNPTVLVQDKDFFDYGFGQTFGFVKVSPDGDKFLFRSRRSGWINYWIKPLDGGKVKPLYSEEADQSNAEWSPDGGKVVLTSNYNGTHRMSLVDVAKESLTQLVSPDMGVISNVNWSPDGKKISYTLETPTSPKDIYVINRDGSGKRRVTYSMETDDYQQQLVQPQKIKYESTDGFTISAYLYKPKTTGKYPGLMWIHGGPTSQFNDTFQQHVQYFVSKGYVILQPNIRGSSGYGKDFEKANQKCWGHCDLEDVQEGVKYLKNLARVDSTKIGIHGTSYGGQMSMAAAAFAPDLFQVSIPASGYANEIKMVENPNELRDYKMTNYELGNYEENKDVRKYVSSIFSVDKIKTPMLLIQGEGKYPSIEQTKEFAQELEAHYKTFEYEIYPNENYYVTSKKNRKKMLQDMLAFMNKFLKQDIVTH